MCQCVTSSVFNRSVGAATIIVQADSSIWTVMRDMPETVCEGVCMSRVLQTAALVCEVLLYIRVFSVSK